MCLRLSGFQSYLELLKPSVDVFKRSVMESGFDVINSKKPNSKASFLHYAVLHLRADLFVKSTSRVEHEILVYMRDKAREKINSIRSLCKKHRVKSAAGTCDVRPILENDAVILVC